MDIEEIARKQALKNASEHGGEANPGSVIGSVIAEGDADPGEAQRIVPEVVQEVNSLSVEEQKKEMEKYEFIDKEQDHDPLPDLKDANEGGVVVRFAPNPNGPPHIGHARGMVINGELRDKYDGKLILRFDDTDPVTKRPVKEAYEMYQEDYSWLGYEPDEVRYSSKNFDTYIEYAEKLIQMEKAYVCKCSQEKGQRYRKEGEPCPHRDQSAEENMELWKSMKKGSIEEGEATLKMKTDMQHKNPSVRDFVAFRIIDDPDHPITGYRYRVWPLLDFQGAIEDHEMGTTHIVRGKDLRASTERQKYIYDYLDWDYPDVSYWGNVQISGFDAPVSGSTLKQLISEGELNGWDDPRAPTLRALRKRGFQPEAIRNFFVDMGVSERNIEASAETLESENRDIVEDRDRCFFVRDPVELEISGIPEDLEIKVPLHPDHEERGYRRFDVSVENGSARVMVEREDLQDGLMRLKGFCNVEVDGSEASYIEGDHTVAVENEAPIVHWLPVDSDSATVEMPDGTSVEGRIEREIGPDTVLQFERFGFVRRDRDGKFYFAHE